MEIKLTIKQEINKINHVEGNKSFFAVFFNKYKFDAY